MRTKVVCILGAAAAVLSGCGNHKKESQVISQQYIHKYGYAVSKEEWNAKKYPGQVITTLRNGVTLTSTFENGVLHGPTTRTYPHSQTVENYSLYNGGAIVKEIRYDIKGMPVRESLQLSPTRYAITLWYADGTPLSIEEFAGHELLDGQYFTMTNEIEARVEKGHGKKIHRDEKGLLLAIEEYAQGYVTKRETFYPTGAPESITHYAQGKLHGEKRTFQQTGEPIVIEEWVHGKLDGKTTHFKNGTKISEVSYLNGIKNGLEIHYLDGEVVSQQIQWENDVKHGPSIYFVAGKAKTEYYYNGEKVEKKDFDAQLRMDEMISQISPELRDAR